MAKSSIGKRRRSIWCHQRSITLVFSPPPSLTTSHRCCVTTLEWPPLAVTVTKYHHHPPPTTTMAHANDDGNGMVTPRHIERPLLLPLTHNRGRLPTTTTAHIDNTSHDTNNAGTPHHKPEQTDKPQMAQRHVAATTWHVNGALRTCHDV
jgi:hypothetical protein